MPEGRVSQLLAEIGWTLTDPRLKVSQLFIEVGFIYETIITPSPVSTAASVVSPTTHEGSQFAYPSADSSLGGWTDENGGTTNIYTHINEVSANDANYVHSSGSPSSDIYKFKVDNLSDPECEGGHIISYRYFKEETGTVNLTVRLMQGVSTIATWTHNDIGTVTQADQELTAEQANSITDYTNLYIELEATST